jgi:hypothetical protein
MMATISSMATGMARAASFGTIIDGTAIAIIGMAIVSTATNLTKTL